ncbi:MAG: YihY/virulence factor BrkB family protein [Bacteroidales bacterium]|nr:YihY/virulence factor BrkB family protein [Bacteroidales bacterium]
MDIKKIKDTSHKLFGDQLWELNTEGLSGIRRRVVRFIKLIRITFNTFAEQRMGFQCVALSYFSALAIVPFAAFIFAVGGGLGVDDKLSILAHEILPSNPEFIDTVLDKAGNIVHIARSGIVGVIGAFAFLWTIIWLFFQVERVFNNVWGIRKIPRKLYTRFSFYFLAMFLAPFILLMFGAGIAIYSNITSLVGIRVHIAEVSGFMTLLGWVVFYAVAVFTFSAMYKFIPAPKVYYRNAFIAALVSGFVFVLFQFVYLKTQIFVTRLNAVYGVLAAIPLFLMWLNYSWQIIIYGAQLCYGIQNVDSYHIPEGRLKDFTPMWDRIREELKEEEEEESI